ncbi:UNVERIFIED_CONTAM: hypothetical protein HDU68_009944 [Siphonaria sp. JEL0065]|nr:hypothetical protein HDU68_009944 [Siphonaria sp. JEL0065]
MKVVKKSSTIGASEVIAIPPLAVDDFDASIASSEILRVESSILLAKCHRSRGDSQAYLDPHSTASSSSSTKISLQPERRLSEGEAKRQRSDSRLPAQAKAPEASQPISTFARKESDDTSSSIPMRRDPRPLSVNSSKETKSREPKTHVSGSQQSGSDNEALIKKYRISRTFFLATLTTTQMLLPQPTISKANHKCSHIHNKLELTSGILHEVSPDKQRDNRIITQKNLQLQSQQRSPVSSARAPQRPPAPVKRTLPFNTRAWTSKLMPKVANTKGKGKYDTNSEIMNYLDFLPVGQPTLTTKFTVTGSVSIGGGAHITVHGSFGLFIGADNVNVDSG